jgi:hypothetical protein
MWPKLPKKKNISLGHWAMFSHKYLVTLVPGLPDFSWYMIPKPGINDNKCTKSPQNISNGRKIDQMVFKYTKIFHSKTLKNLRKLGFLV